MTYLLRYSNAAGGRFISDWRNSSDALFIDINVRFKLLLVKRVFIYTYNSKTSCDRSRSETNQRQMRTAIKPSRPPGQSRLFARIRRGKNNTEAALSQHAENSTYIALFPEVKMCYGRAFLEMTCFVPNDPRLFILHFGLSDGLRRRPRQTLLLRGAYFSNGAKTY